MGADRMAYIFLDCIRTPSFSANTQSRMILFSAYMTDPAAPLSVHGYCCGVRSSEVGVSGIGSGIQYIRLTGPRLMGVGYHEMECGIVRQINRLAPLNNGTLLLQILLARLC